MCRGAGIHAQSGYPISSVSGYNNIVYFNQATTNPDVYGNIYLTYSCMSASVSGTGNITSDPLFVDVSNNDYHLQLGSPCIDAGDPSSPLDPDGTVADMGALYRSQSPSLSVTPQNLTFYGIIGSGNPANQTFQISNSGSMTFNYSISESISWLTVNPTSGGPVPPTATETVSVNISGLSAGTYHGNIIITANGAEGSPDTVAVTLFVTQDPILSISPHDLTFNGELGGNNPTNQTFQLNNLGSGTYNYTISESISWLSVNPTYGGPVPPNATITVSVDITGLSAGTHQGDIVVTANGAQGSPDTVSVTLNITQNPILFVSPKNLTFYAEVCGSNPGSETIQISNIGTGTFNYNIFESVSWLNVTPGSGGPVPPTATETVSVDIYGLSAGAYQCQFLVVANGVQGSPDTVSVTLFLTQNPVLSVSPTNLSFYAEVGGSNPGSQTFQISNSGSGTFNYTLSESISWLSVTPLTGGPVPPAATETVSVNISGLSAGTYNGDIIVTANGAQGSPDTVSVTLFLYQNPVLSVSPANLSFYAEVGGSNPGSQTFQISNSGTGTFNYTLSESISWLSVTPLTGGPVPPTATETVSVNISGLSAGTYNGDIIITANGALGSPDTVSVMLTITQNPILEIQPESIQVYAEIGGNNPSNEYFSIDNIGTGTLNYSIYESVSWLSLSQSSGGPVPPVDAIAISFDITGMQVGDYQGEIIVEAPSASNSPDTLCVYLNIFQNPVLSISTDNLIFNAIRGEDNPSNQTFQINNNGSGSFNYAISESASWLEVSPMAGGPVPPTATETVSVDISGLSVGTYNTGIVITANGAQGSPDTVSVTLNVLQPPTLSVSPRLLTYYAEVGGSNPANQTFHIANSGSGTFNYTLSESTSWLSVTPTSGGLVPPTATKTVSINISGLSVGTYNGDIIITATGAQGSPDTVSVTLIVTQDPILVVFPDIIQANAEVGGNNPSNAQFFVDNVGSGTLNYTISESVSWLSISQNNGGPVPPQDEITITFDITGLQVGDYQGDIVVQASGALNSPDTVHVYLTIFQEPILSISTDSLTFNAELGGENPPDQTFQIHNIGSGTLNYIAVDNIPWLEVTPVSGGPVPPSAIETVSVDITELSAGNYTGLIAVDAINCPGNPELITVCLEITENPLLSVTPDTLIFDTQIGGTIPGNQLIQIANLGTGTFDYTITEDISWLSLSRLNGGPVPPTATDTVSIDTAGLSAGVYEGDIVVTASGAQGSPDTVHVIFNIVSQSVLLLEREDITFHFTQGGEIPEPETFTVANAGGGIFYFEAVESASWLELSDTLGGPVPPTFEDTVFVVDITGLSPGVYEHDIVIYAEGALHSPESIHVVLDITANDIQSLANSKIPTEYALQSPYPNPFNPVTNLVFALPQPGNVRITIFDIQGRTVANLIDEWRRVGTYQVAFDASQLSSGTYFCQITANNYIAVKKLILLK